MSSWQGSKEGDLLLCILPNGEILRETVPRNIFCPETIKFKLNFLTWGHIPSF